MPGKHNRVHSGTDPLIAAGMDPVMGFEEIGRAIGVSRSQVQWIYRSAIYKLTRQAEKIRREEDAMGLG